MFSEKIVSLHSKARSFDIMQNKAEYRTSLVSKSLPIAKRLSAIYSFPIAKTIRCVSLRGYVCAFGNAWKKVKAKVTLLKKRSVLDW